MSARLSNIRTSMNSTLRVALLLCLLSAYLSEVEAQEIPIDIQKALELAGAQNHTIERLAIQQQLAAADVAIAQESVEPRPGSRHLGDGVGLSGATIGGRHDSPAFSSPCQYLT